MRTGWTQASEKPVRTGYIPVAQIKGKALVKEKRKISRKMEMK